MTKIIIMMKSFIRPAIRCYKPSALQSRRAFTSSTITSEEAGTWTTTGWEHHKLNCNNALMKADEAKHFQELVKAPVTTLQGIGDLYGTALNSLGIHTVEDLGKYKFYRMARAMAVLEATEETIMMEEKRQSVMNVDKAVIKEYETYSFKEMIESPVHALQGLSERSGSIWKDELGVKTIQELANYKFCRWAEAMVDLAPYEEVETLQERRLKREKKKE